MPIFFSVTNNQFTVSKRSLLNYWLSCRAGKASTYHPKNQCSYLQHKFGWMSYDIAGVSDSRREHGKIWTSLRNISISLAPVTRRWGQQGCRLEASLPSLRWKVVSQSHCLPRRGLFEGNTQASIQVCSYHLKGPRAVTTAATLSALNRLTFKYASGDDKRCPLSEFVCARITK